MKYVHKCARLHRREGRNGRPGVDGTPHAILFMTTLISATVLVTVAAFLILGSLQAFSTIGLMEMLGGTLWSPTSYGDQAFGLLPLMAGTFLVSLLASLIAIP